MACEQVSTGGLSRIAIPARHSAIAVGTREKEDHYNRYGAGVAAALLLLPSMNYPLRMWGLIRSNRYDKSLCALKDKPYRRELQALLSVMSDE